MHDIAECLDLYGFLCRCSLHRTWTPACGAHWGGIDDWSEGTTMWCVASVHAARVRTGDPYTGRAGRAVTCYIEHSFLLLALRADGAGR